MTKKSFAIVDERDEHKLIVYGEDQINKNGGYHRAVHVLIEAFGGQFILQKIPKGAENEGKWSSAIFGHVRYTENYEEAAIRKMDEYLGIKAVREDLNKVTKISPSEKTNNEFITVFTYLLDQNQEELTLNPEKVDEIVISTLTDVISDVGINTDDYSSTFMEVFNIFLFLEKDMGGNQ